MNSQTNQKPHARKTVHDAINLATTAIVTISMVLSLYGCGSTESLSLTVSAMQSHASDVAAFGKALLAGESAGGAIPDSTGGQGSATSEEAAKQEETTPDADGKQDGAASDNAGKQGDATADAAGKQGDEAFEAAGGKSDATSDDNGGQGDATAKATDGKSDAAKSDEAWTQTLTKTVTLAADKDKPDDQKRSYVVTVTYDQKSGVDRNAELAVEELESNDDRKRDLNERLEVQEGEYVAQESFLGIRLKVDGQEVQPQADVQVTVETNAIGPRRAASIEAALLGDADVSKLAVTNLTEKDEKGEDLPADAESPTRARVRLSASRLGEIGLAVVAAPKHELDINGVAVTVLGPRSVMFDVSDEECDDVLADDKTLVRLLSMTTDPAFRWAPAVWLCADDTRAEDGRAAFLSVHVMEDGAPASELFGRVGTSTPVATDAGQQLGFVWHEPLEDAAKDEGDETANSEASTDEDAEAEDASAQEGVPAKDASSAGSQDKSAPKVDEAPAQGKNQETDASSAGNDGKGAPKLEDAPAQEEKQEAVASDAKDEDKGAPQTEDSGKGQQNTNRRLTATDGKTYNVTATFDASSGIPISAQLRVREIATSDVDYLDYLAQSVHELGTSVDNVDFVKPLDISFVDAVTGREYQPDGNVNIAIELLNDDLNDYASVDVVHIVDATKGQAEVMNSNVRGDSIEFETDGFSVYVVTGEGAVPRRTYEFFIKGSDGWTPFLFTSNNGEKTSKQTVRDGETLVVPQPVGNTSVDGDEGASDDVFAGWYERTDDNQNNNEPVLASTPYDFSTPVTENEVIELYAQFKNYHYVVFHDQYNNELGSFPIADTRRAETNEEGKATIQINDVSTTYSGGSDMAFYGWSYSPITNPGDERDDKGEPVSKIQTDAIEISADTPLYPIYKSVKWLYFWSGPTGSGATYCPAQHYFDGNGPSELPVPSRSGYTFQGWYAGSMNDDGSVVYGSNPIADANGNLIDLAFDGGMRVYDGHLHLSHDATLYAKWEGQESTSYKVIVWRQKATAQNNTPTAYKYDFVESEIKTVPIGSMATTDGHHDQLTGYECHYDQDVVVSKKGDIVLNVYYDRTGTYTSSGTSHKLKFVNTADDREITYDTVAFGTSLLTGNGGGSFVPANPTRNNYTFTGWFADANCTTQVFFSKQDLDAFQGNDSKVLYDQMPDNDLSLYAGWEADWYLVQVDPNYGSFNGSGGTWMWKTIESDLVQEYTQVTRDYVESSSGNYYYAKQDRAYHGYKDNTYYDNEPSNRDAYYTTNPGEATEYKTFEKVPGAYSYEGWYEVLGNGTEVPYDFNQHVDHDTFIRLHWKKAGAFYIKYDAGEGVLDTGGTEATDANAYADNAQIVVTRGAVAPEGYTFVGWRVKGDTSGVAYRQTELYTLQSDYAASVSGKNTVTLEAVYTRLDTARLVYDANGGSMGSRFDYGHAYETSAPDIAYALAEDGKSATVSGIVNNSSFVLGNGTGISMPNATLKGWSTSKVYDPAKDTLYTLGGTYGVDTKEPTTLYAVWEVKATYHLNVPSGAPANAYNWGGEWDSSIYKREGDDYCTTLYTGNNVTEPTYIPQYTGTESRTFKYWTTDANGGAAYDFSNPVTDALDLYACWGEPETVTVHAVDASTETLAEKTANDGWTVSNIQAGTNAVQLDEANGNRFVTPPANSNYAFAFAAVSTDINSVSEANEVTAIKYDSSTQNVRVKYKGETEFRALGEGGQIYLVYYAKKALKIGYKKIGPSGVLENVTVSEAAPTSTGDAAEKLLGSYKMSDNISNALTLANGGGNQFTNYAFAIGQVDPQNGTEVNASHLTLITAAAGAGDDVPKLDIQNTWRGFDYASATETGSCGYDPQLYVIYYEQKPTVITFREETVGLDTYVKDTTFEYNLLVTETTTNVQRQCKVEGRWADDGTTTDMPSVIVTSLQYRLKSGDENSATLFYGVPAADTQIGDEFVEGGKTYRYVATANSVTSQTAEITQAANESFTTSINGTEQITEPYVYTYTAKGDGGAIGAIFTNKHKEQKIEVHVARIEGGSVKLRDDLRGTDEATYTFPLPIEEEAKLLNTLPAATVYDDADGAYAFNAVAYGDDDGTNVTLEGLGVESIAYKAVNDNIYGLLLKDGSNKQLAEAGNRKVYYLYYPMPMVQYVKQGETGLSLIAAMQDGNEHYIPYDGARLTMNGETVVQNQRIALMQSGILISQATSKTNFKMPPDLDDGTYRRYLTYSGIGIGNVLDSNDATGNASFTSDKCEIRLRIDHNVMQWSFTGNDNDWHSLAEAQAIYAIYEERGYDMQLSKTVDSAQSGTNPIFMNKQFAVTIEPVPGNSFNKEGYKIEGYSVDEIPVEDGKIELTVGDGTKVKILGMRRGGYKITESENDNFDLTAKSGPIVGSATTPESVENGVVKSFVLDTEKQLVLTNAPKAICEVTRGSEEDGQVFYTFADAVNYIVENIPSREANIEMLNDYVVPPEDTLDIPSNTKIKLTTAKTGENQYKGDGKAVISRSADLISASVVSSNGDLTLINITLDGKGDQGIVASQSLVKSGGTLTIERGTTLRNAINQAKTGEDNSGNGGAIYSTGNVSFVSGSDIKLQGNQAQNGGLLYYAGTGAVLVEADGGTISGNHAINNGGAIYAASGTVELRNGTISGNTADINGGAIYAGNAVIEVNGGTIGGSSANKALNGAGIYSASGMVVVSGGSIANNQAATNGSATSANGGAIYAGTGPVTVTGGSLAGNAATSGGGAIYAGSGAVTVSGGTIDANSAENGGAIYAGSGKVTVTCRTLEDNTVIASTITGNTASTSGGAIYAQSGNVEVSGSNAVVVSSNSAASGNGGAIYAGSGTVALSGGRLHTNLATGGNGGAVYVDTGALEVSGGTIGGDGGANEAKNGSAVFANSGTARFSGGSIKNNVASEGGAVGVGDVTARLVFSGTPTVQENMTGDETRNVYLDQDTDAVINTAGMDDGYVGIYVPGDKTASGSLFKKHGDVGTTFGVSTGKDGPINQFHNDREPNLKAVVDSITRRVYWSSGIKVQARYLQNYASALPNGSNGDWKYDNDNYYPAVGNAAISLLADELRGSCSNLSSTSVYATAFIGTNQDYSNYITRLLWENGKWRVEKCDGTKADLNNNKIYIYYSEPTYMSIENNTEFDLDVSPLTVNLASAPRSLVNSSTVTGFGLVFAKNGTIQSSLLPVQANSEGKLVLAKNESINILIPGGGGGRDYSFTGRFNGSGTVRLRRTGQSETTTSASKEFTFSGKTLGTGETYEVVFGNDKTICKIWMRSIYDTCDEVRAFCMSNYDIPSGEWSTWYDALLKNQHGKYTVFDWEEHEFTDESEAKEYCYSHYAVPRISNPEDSGYAAAEQKLKDIIVHKANGTLSIYEERLFAPDLENAEGETDEEKAQNAKVAAEAAARAYIKGQYGSDYCNLSDDLVVDRGNGTYAVYSMNDENAFPTLNAAANFAKAHDLQDVVIEMLVDYLMPNSDVVKVSHADETGYVSLTNAKTFTLTTARTGKLQYPGEDPDRRATISRGLGNIQPLVDVAGSLATGPARLAFARVHDLNFDGKNLTGKCEGGAIKTTDCEVEVSNVHFANFEAYNGGAIFISYGTPTTVNPGKTKGYTFANGYSFDSSKFTATNVTADNCKAKYVYGRSGGGAIWTNAKTFVANNCTFTNCISDGSNMQGGAVFHRIDSTDKPKDGIHQMPYYATSQTLFNDCAFVGCTAQAGGAMESDATDIQLTGCSFTSCSTTAKDGGALNVYIFEQDSSMNYNSIPSTLVLNNCKFVETTAYRNGGAVRSMAVDNEFKDCTFTNTSSRGNGKGGGAIYVSNNRSNTTTVTGCTFTGAISNNGPGGAICTYSKELVVQNTAMSGCQAKGGGGHGGGIYHLVTASKYDGHINNVGSFASLSGCTITGCTAEKKGGGLYTNAFNARKRGSKDINENAANVEESIILLERCTIDNCKALGEYGGGVHLDSGAMVYATIEGSTIKNCEAAWSGGGLYSKATYLTIRSSMGPSSGEAIKSRIEDCASNATKANDITGGGGLFHSRGNSFVEFTDLTINACTAKQDGGGMCITDAKSLILTNAAIQNNTATNGKGGGICYSTSGALNLTNATVSGNKAGDLGGGIYTKQYLTLAKSIIKNNQLANNEVNNAAGVYIASDNGKLTIGKVGSAKDNSAVMNNTTNNGADSNLRMPIKTNQENQKCVTVNCNLGAIDGEGGYIGVTNAWKVGTQFGVSAITNPGGLQDPDGIVVKDAVFNADTSTLYGIIKRDDDTRTKIVWAGPPICKITDDKGNLLYFKGNGSDPAIFDVLEDGASNGRTSAFALLRGKPNLYYAPATEGGTDGVKYTGTSFTIKMLVEEYELTTQITTANDANKTITLTTASKNDKDGYPLDQDVSGKRATITRGPNVAGSMAVATANMKFTNILLDGKNVTSNQNGGIVQVGTSNAGENIEVELLSDAVLQYGKAANGGAVSVTKGAFELNGGIVRFCEATNNGGAVYAANSDGTKGLSLMAGSIQQCKAQNGAGIYVADGVCNMTGGSISGCAASKSGGGVFVAAGKTFNMSGGGIGRDGANNAGEHGGGIAAEADAKLNFSKRVNVSRNTCNRSVAAGQICNVELEQDSNKVINISSEGLYGRSYIGVYVPGDESADSQYDKHGIEGKPFGTFADGVSTAQLYCFVNDRNGLKGGLIANPDPNTIYWIKIFTIEVSKNVEVSDSVPEAMRQQAQGVQAGSEEDSTRGQEFEFTVRLWDTDENTSGVKVKDIADEVKKAAEAGEESMYGGMQFAYGSDSAVISATITLAHGEMLTVENLPDGIGYDITEQPVEGYANIPTKTEAGVAVYDSTKPVYIQSGKTGENKDRAYEVINPYVSTVSFHNILPVCKITDSSGNLLYRNGPPSGGDQTPAVYKELGEAIAAVNSGHLYRNNNDVSYSGACSIEMLMPDYTLAAGQTLTTNRPVTLKTAATGAADNFPYSGTGVAAIRRGTAFTNASMLTLNNTSNLTLTNVALDGNRIATTADGGLVHVDSGATLAVTDGAKLQSSRTTGNGAGVYVANGGRLVLFGSPAFGGTDTDGYGFVLNNIGSGAGNFRLGELKDSKGGWQKNGGREYKYAHQDIYLEGTNSPNVLGSLVVSGPLDVNAGSIWVWAAEKQHYETLTQFAVFESENVRTSMEPGQLAKTFAAFRNAQPDELTGCGADYLTGQQGDVPTNIYWTGGFDFTFFKMDPNAKALDDATFTLYKANAAGDDILMEGGAEVAFQRNGANVTATSRTVQKDDAVKVKVRAADESVVQENVWGKGLATFEKIPPATYFIKETVFPKVDPNDDSEGAIRFKANHDKYKVVLDGNGTMEMFFANGEGDDGKTKWEPVSEAEVATADDKTARLHAVLDVSPYLRKVMLRKVSEDDDMYQSLDGAKFRVYNVAWEELNDTEYESNAVTGVYFIDTLPYGVYYLVETAFPGGYSPAGYEGYKQDEPNTWLYYKLTVGADGQEIDVVDESGNPIKLDARGVYVQLDGGNLFRRR